MNRIFVVLLALALLCASCAARINGSLQGDGKADLSINVSLEPRITMLISGFAAVSGVAQPGAPILDGPAIAASMAAAPGVASASFRNTSPSAIEGPLRIARIGDFLAPGLAPNRANSPESRGFITFEQNAPSGGSSGGKCTVNLSLATGPEILTLISPEMRDYLSALMAPLATGEALTKAAYLTLVSSVYGRGIADEISGALINASLDFPGPIQSVKGGTFSGKRAVFAIPLLDVLVLETPLSYEVVWGM